MRIKNRRIARDMSTISGFTVCCFAFASLIFAVLTLMIGTDGEIYRQYRFPGMFVSMFCYSLAFVAFMLFLGAYVGICVEGPCCQSRGDILICGVSALICAAASVPLAFQAKAFFYAFLLIAVSLTFFLFMTFKRERGNLLTAVLCVLCGAGYAYQLYVAFSLMLLN